MFLCVPLSPQLTATASRRTITARFPIANHSIQHGCRTACTGLYTNRPESTIHHACSTLDTSIPVSKLYNFSRLSEDPMGAYLYTATTSVAEFGSELEGNHILPI